MLDVSSNTKLNELHCYNNKLSALNLSANTALEILMCGNSVIPGMAKGENAFTSLDISHNTQLTYLECSGIPQLTSLTFGTASALTGLVCYSCGLSGTLDVSAFADLANLSCWDNALTALNLSNCTKLQSLSCGDNSLTSLDLTNNPLLNPDTVTADQGVVISWYETDDLPINAENFPDEYFRAYLKYYADTSGDGYLSDEEIAAVKTIDVSMTFPGETDLPDYYGDPVSDLTGIGYFTNLTSLSCDMCDIKSLDLSANTKLAALSCQATQITSLDLSANKALTKVYVGSNEKLTALNVSGCTALTQLSCNRSSLTALDVSSNTNLTSLSCGYNSLTSLDVSKNTKLAEIECSCNSLTSLSVSGLPHLEELWCSNNSLTWLNVTGCTALTDNKISCDEGVEIVDMKAVTGTKATAATATSVKLSWAAVNGVTGYQIYKYDEAKDAFASHKFVTGTSVTLSGLTCGTTYKYKVRGYYLPAGSTTKVYGPFGAVVSAKPVPAQVTGTKAASASASSVKLSWTAVSGATGYQIYRYDSAKGTYVSYKFVTGTSYTATGLTCGTTYKYKVRAYYLPEGSTTKLYGAFGDVVSAKPVPAQVTGTKAASAGATSVKLTWTKVTGATGYQVYKYDSAKGTYVSCKFVTDATATVTGLTAGTTYKYKVRAYVLPTGSTAKVYGTFGSVVSAKPVPAQVTGTKAVSASATSIKLTWTKVTGATGYQIYKYDSSKGTYVSLRFVTGTTSTVTGLTAGTTYKYKVRAYTLPTGSTAKVYGAFGSAVSAKPVPAQVTGVKAAAASATSVKLTWTKVTGATGYQVLRATSKTGTYSAVKTVTSGSAVTFTDTGRTTGKTYYYKVRAYRTEGSTKVYGAYSSIVAGKAAK